MFSVKWFDALSIVAGCTGGLVDLTGGAGREEVEPLALEGRTTRRDGVRVAGAVFVGPDFVLAGTWRLLAVGLADSLAFSIAFAGGAPFAGGSTFPPSWAKSETENKGVKIRRGIFITRGKRVGAEYLPLQKYSINPRYCE